MLARSKRMFAQVWYMPVFLLLGMPACLGGEVFFHEARTDWRICLSPQAQPAETYAAQELRDALRKISGADFELLTTDEPPEHHAIIIGDLNSPQVRAQAAALNLNAGPVEAIAVYTLGGRLYLAGNQPRGALYAVYHFLQHELGVRWLWPGSDGEFMPAKLSWSLPELKHNYQPPIAYRGFHLCGDWRDVELFREWMGRNFINIHRHAASPDQQRRGFHSMWSSHNVRLPESLFDQHPECFAEIQGQRYKSNICFSNPEVDKIIAAETAEYVRKRPFLELLSLFPNDNQDYCRCARCATSDVSTAWFEFYNRLTDALKIEFPDLKFATIAYQGYRDVPQCTVRNSEFIEYASHGRCNIHAYGQAGCQHNDDTMHAMLAWQATGLPIGHYGYEFDVYTKNPRFLPFLSVIDDAVKTSRRLGHVAVIPEISLSPKHGPEVYAHHVQNRLALYLYARLLWDPDEQMNDVLDDWCRTTFGEAGTSMGAYYRAMDRAWTAMPIHATILGNALNAAPHLLTDPLRAEVAKAFSNAEQRLPTIADAGARSRAAAALARERILYNQWQDLYRLSTDAPRINLPRLADADGLAQSASRPQALSTSAGDPDGYSTHVRLAWTKDALLVHWICRDRQIGNLKTAASARDASLNEDDSVELVLSSGLSGETWHFATNARGTQQDYRDTNVGVRDDRWDPRWQATTRVVADAWEAEFRVPFAELGRVPNPNETWQARFLRHGGGRQEIASPVFPEREMASLLFSPAARTDRALLWWSGAPDREAQRDAALSQEFLERGWQLNLVSDDQKLIAGSQQADAYWFRHPHGPNKVPAAYWQTHLAPAIKDGAVAVFVSYWPIPLDQYFDDPSLQLKPAVCGRIPLAARVSSFIAPGDWSTQPNNLLGALKTAITPAYGFEPADPAAWTVLATAPGGGDRPFPYLLARRYGQGLIVVGGDDIRIAPARLLENLLAAKETQFTAAASVERFGLFEATLTASGTSANPYAELAAEATLTPPGGQQPRTVPLFWDGGSSWKFRISPDQPGTWRWTTRSRNAGLDGKSGSFSVTDSSRRGSLRPMRGFPYHFEYQDGSACWFMGDTAWALFTDNADEQHDRAAAFRYLQTRAGQGFNAVHAMLLSEAGWGNVGGQPWQDLGQQRINPGYWQEVDRRLAYANSQGLVVGLVLAWGDKRKQEPYAWRRFPNVEARERYARYIAARFAAFEVYFIVSGEWHAEVQTRPASEDEVRREFSRIGDEIGVSDPQGRMIAIHPMNSGGSVREFNQDAWMAFGDYQQNYRDLHERLLQSRRFDKPVVNSEYGYHLRDQNGDGVPDKDNSTSLESIRHATWDLVMGGGYVLTGFGTTYFGGNRDPGPFDLDAARNKPWEQQMSELKKFFVAREWWKLAPHDELLRSKTPRGKDTRQLGCVAPPPVAYWCLAEPGRQYVVYARGLKQPVQLTVDDPATLEARQFNPRTGESAELQLEFRDHHLHYLPPDEQDWVVVIAAGGGT